MRKKETSRSANDHTAIAAQSLREQRPGPGKDRPAMGAGTAVARGKSGRVLFSRNIELKPHRPVSSWRKLALGSWASPNNPSIYGMFDVDARPLLAKQEDLRAKGFEVTATAFAAKAVATAMAEYPNLNGFIRWGRICYRKNVDIFLLVAVDDIGRDLSGTVIRDCDKKSLEEICQEIHDKAGTIKQGQDKDFNRIKLVSRFVPGWLMRPLLSLVHFVLYSLNVWSPLLCVPRDGFGSAMVTSVGMLGAEHVFAPLMPHARNPLIVLVGKIADQVKAENGKVVIRPMMPICATLDHRFIDGVGAARMMHIIQRYFANPY